VEDKEDGEEAVEDVVGREHLHQLGSFHGGAENDPGREKSQSGCDPAGSKDTKCNIADRVILGVVEELSGF